VGGYENARFCGYGGVRPPPADGGLYWHAGWASVSWTSSDRSCGRSQGFFVISLDSLNPISPPPTNAGREAQNELAVRRSSSPAVRPAPADIRSARRSAPGSSRRRT